MATQVVITVQGGVVQSVHSDDPDIEVEVVDWDNIKEMTPDLDLAGKENEVNEKLAGFTEVY